MREGAFKVQVSQKNKGPNRLLEVSGSLTVANASKLKKAILANLKKGHHLELVVGDVTDVDLSFIQIIAAANKSAEKGDREFKIRSPVPDPIVRNLRLAGFLNHERCTNKNCLWCSINMQIQGV